MEKRDRSIGYKTGCCGCMLDVVIHDRLMGIPEHDRMLAIHDQLLNIHDRSLGKHDRLLGTHDKLLGTPDRLLGLQDIKGQWEYWNRNIHKGQVTDETEIL